MIEIRVQPEDFDVGRELDRLAAGDTDVGAVVSFTGLVRGGATTAMTLEHYPAMTEKEITEIAREAEARWPIAAGLVIHRYGRLEPGDRIVLVAIASKHRAAAFEAAQFLMDWLKTRAPFWKSEASADGPRWVAANEADETAAARWKK